VRQYDKKHPPTQSTNIFFLAGLCCPEIRIDEPGEAGNVLRFDPALTIDREDIARLLEILRELLS